ncbi:MAG: hypothetical protein P1U80_00805 [Pseudomonadales bacterium]|nr:hypothetical protein [Pseudomonadales bacterium]
MNKSIKNIFPTVLFILALPATADVYFSSGPVKGIYWRQSSNGTFSINGFSSAGSCPTNDGLVAIAFPEGEDGKFSQSIVLASQLAGKELNVRVNDSSKNSSGVCYLYVVERID